MSERPTAPVPRARPLASIHAAPLAPAAREQLTRKLLALLGADGCPRPGVDELAAEVDAAVGAITAQDARRICDDIENQLRIRQLYERFRSFYEASQRVSRRLRELDKDLVELARFSELFRPDAYEDIALFHAALERARGGCGQAGIALDFPGAEPGAELAFVNYLAKARPGRARTAPAKSNRIP